MGVSCDPGCADWAKSFGDCICSPKDLSSFVLGLISVFCMGICCLPQIIINFMNGSSEGLSLGMILIWSVGDVCNLTGVFLTKAVSCLTKPKHICPEWYLHCLFQCFQHKGLFAQTSCCPLLQLPTQVYMAVLFAVLDLLLNFQHCWYCYWIIPRRKKRQLAQGTAASTAPGQLLYKLPPCLPMHLSVGCAVSMLHSKHSLHRLASELRIYCTVLSVMLIALCYYLGSLYSARSPFKTRLTISMSFFASSAGQCRELRRRHSGPRW